MSKLLSPKTKETIKYFFCRVAVPVLGDELITRIKYKIIFKRKPNLIDPKTLNEKILWLKLYKHEKFHTTVADKYACRKWLSDRFGEEYLIPLLFYTDDYKKINSENIPDTPCIIKSNSGCGTNFIVKDKKNLNYREIQKECKKWLSRNYYYVGQEWQYKNIKPYILIEKLLLTEDGKIPNDYKLNFINGKLEFIYCSIDREGRNYRKVYSPDWEPMDFIWITRGHSKNDYIGPEIDAPQSFEMMKKIGSEIAKLFDYVRVDFYDVDGTLYYGEITLHHGGGTDRIIPEEYDRYYGEQLELHKGKNDESINNIGSIR